MQSQRAEKLNYFYDVEQYMLISVLKQSSKNWNSAVGDHELFGFNRDCDTHESPSSCCSDLCFAVTKQSDQGRYRPSFTCQRLGFSVKAVPFGRWSCRISHQQLSTRARLTYHRFMTQRAAPILTSAIFSRPKRPVKQVKASH